MSKRHNQQERELKTSVRLWTHARATKAVPYFRSITRSLRENWLDLRRTQMQADRIDASPQRADRQQRIVRDEFRHQAKLAQNGVDGAWDELASLNVYSIDPMRGLALIPFARGDQLAWFVFDSFDPSGLVAWRNDSDPPEKLRPFVEGFDSDATSMLPAAAIDLLMSEDTQSLDDVRENRRETQK